MTEAFAAGDTCILVDTRGRRYLFDIKPGQTFQYHQGYLRHNDLVGSKPGDVVRSNLGSRIVVLRPRLADYVLKMPRGAQVVYPKDIGPIIHWADIRPGDTVVEAGTGSGALSMALLRAVGPTGRLVSVEAREDHKAHAETAIQRFLGELPENLTLVAGRVEEALADYQPDRIILDLPEPWEVVLPAAEALTAGGIICSYLPTVPQVQHFHDALRRSRRFALPETFEILIRDWKFDGRSVRPQSTMVGHTGFITTAFHTELVVPESEDPAEGAGSVTQTD